MKNILILLSICFLISGCNKDDSPNDNNPYLLDPLVGITLNLNLPQYNALKFTGNSIELAGEGLKGIVVYNINNEQYAAFELSDPNHIPSGCSKMEVDGIIATCPCTTDSNEYNIITGQHMLNQNLYPMQRYNAIRTGDVVQISN
ncbi:hypothetical protein [Ulvibacter antarcticus]|uniref:Nitrite reductase/ring-hydroxylating ferredoxin subunit n=1 Tax=Ulvibacter antarcticus TaxID=442714 RepID=A0A3L9Z2F8_9FLAO|nr:hypothetical protein [Ulvibacter antarcticus]RMA66320.1 hypothetical protein BXY75_0742 [Ulvibacter antarcticus]